MGLGMCVCAERDSEGVFPYSSVFMRSKGYKRVETRDLFKQGYRVVTHFHRSLVLGKVRDTF